MVDQRFCTQIGTSKQHAYIVGLCDSLGEPSLRHVVSNITGVSVSKCQRTTFTAKDASKIIDALKARKEKK